jgi:hypothetical protein
LPAKHANAQEKQLGGGAIADGKTDTFAFLSHCRRGRRDKDLVKTDGQQKKLCQTFKKKIWLSNETFLENIGRDLIV